MGMDVYFYEAFEEEAQAIRNMLPADLSAGFTWKTIQEAADTTPPAKIISIRTQSAIPVEWASDLSGILTRSTGYDHVTDYLNSVSSDISAGHLPLYCNRAVAEQAMLLWTALLRRLPQQMQSFRKFHRDGLTGRECLGKTLLIVGVGNIGHQVVQIGRGLGMNVLGVDLIEKHPDVTYTSLEASLPQADIIVCSMNLTPDNTGFFDRNRLTQAKPGVIFVNIARGEMSPSQHLLEMLNEGHLGGVGLDVYDSEKQLAVALRSGSSCCDSPSVASTLELSQHPNVITTPHNAFNTQEAVQRKAAQSIESIVHFMQTGRFTSEVLS